MDKLLELLRKLSLVVVYLLVGFIGVSGFILVGEAGPAAAWVGIILAVLVLLVGIPFVNWLFSYQDKSE